MSSAGGASYSPARYVHSPLHPSERPIHADDRSPLRGLGNLFWDDIEKDHRWDEVRGEILGMIFCSPIGNASPEKLWWAASRLGVHSAARSEPDEGYQRLKAEEKELLDRLRNVENVDHDRLGGLSNAIESLRNSSNYICSKTVRFLRPWSPAQLTQPSRNDLPRSRSSYRVLVPSSNTSSSTSPTQNLISPSATIIGFRSRR